MENLEVMQNEKNKAEEDKTNNAIIKGVLLGVVTAFIIACIGTAVLPVVMAYVLHNWTWLLFYPGSLIFVILVSTFK